MVVFARTHASELVQGRAAEDLFLRVVGTARNGQVVRLTAPKCTIGSARGCTLRLQAVGVRPLQCVILRGARGTLARCWSRGTKLNGEYFVDAPLAAGDRLSIGPIELEVLAAIDANALSREAEANRPLATQQPTAGDHDVTLISTDLDNRLDAFQRGCQQWEISRVAREAELEARARQLAETIDAVEALSLIHI